MNKKDLEKWLIIIEKLYREGIYVNSCDPGIRGEYNGASFVLGGNELGYVLKAIDDKHGYSEKDNISLLNAYKFRKNKEKKFFNKYRKTIDSLTRRQKYVFNSIVTNSTIGVKCLKDDDVKVLLDKKLIKIEDGIILKKNF